MAEETGGAWPPWRRAEVMRRRRKGGSRGQEEEKRTLWLTERCAEDEYHPRANPRPAIWKRRRIYGKEQKRKRERKGERERDGEKCPDVTSSGGVQPHGPTLINKVAQR